ncbi:hypothetical protein FACS1894103_1240 [Campylobacterota bacterium]|nr:hypothetical protein FACS1894103_1240 [Campylobacterota bacterium]
MAYLRNFAFAALAIVSLISCGGDSNDTTKDTPPDGSETPLPPPSPSVVTLLDLSSLVTASATGASPVTTPFGTTEYNGTIAWKNSSDGDHYGVFAAFAVYKAVVILTVNAGYTFDGAAGFSHLSATAVANTTGIDSVTVTITFQATNLPVVTSLDISSLVTAPSKDASPDRDLIETTEYNGTIAWKVGDSAFGESAFAPAIVYKAVVTLTANAGYTFTGVAADTFIHTGADSVTNGANSGVITIVFPITAPSAPTLTLTSAGGGAFVGTTNYHTTATITAAAKNGTSPVEIGSNHVIWTVVSSSITAAWWGDIDGRSRSQGALNGLAWGTTPISLTGYDNERTDMSGNGNQVGVSTTATATLTDIVGSRQVVLKAEVTIGGEIYAGTTTINFGAGPLSEFKGAPKGSMNWGNAVTACGGTPGDLSGSGYKASTKLPTYTHLLAVVSDLEYGIGHGAAHAAGWRDDAEGSGKFQYWTGETFSGGSGAMYVRLDNGGTPVDVISHDTLVAVCLP